jgi:hypothetical protein
MTLKIETNSDGHRNLIRLIGRVRSELKGEASMIKFNSCLVIIGLSIGLFFINHAATAAEAQQRDLRFQQNLEQLRQQQIDQLQREQQLQELQQQQQIDQLREQQQKLRQQPQLNR